MTGQERVVLLSDDGRGIGAALKSEVHHTETPLHLAFSCHLVHADGRRVLVTRRALGKKTWPGTWTNAFCGHPQPFEPVPDAVTRRAGDELGVALRDVRLVLPDFRYRAVDVSGIVENEICPVYVATAVGEPSCNPDEAMDARWVEPEALVESARLAPWAFSPWLVEQLAQMSGIPGALPLMERQR
jgi:isopentenyl-diphosphate delta-isomerase